MDIHNRQVDPPSKIDDQVKEVFGQNSSEAQNNSKLSSDKNKNSSPKRDNIQMIQQGNPSELNRLKQINLLFPKSKNIAQCGAILQQGNYNIYIRQKISATLSSIYYCEQIQNISQNNESQSETKNKLLKSTKKQKNDGTMIEQQRQQKQQDIQEKREMFQLQASKFIPKVMRITPKRFLNQPIEGLYGSEYLRMMYESATCRDQHLEIFVKYFAFFEDDENIFSVSEQYETNLSEFLLKKYPTENDFIEEDKAIEYLFQIFILILYMQESGMKIIQSLKLTSILVDKSENLKFPLLSYSTYNIPIKSAPPESLKYVAPEIITSNFRISSSQIQSVWTLGVLLLDIILKGRQIGPFDLPPLIQQLSGKAKTPILIQKIMQFDLKNYLESNPILSTRYSNQFILLLQSLLEINPINRISMNQLRNHPYFLNRFSQNLNYDNNTLKVAFVSTDSMRTPFSLKELKFK